MKLDGELVSERRRELGLSRREVASICGAGVTFIQAVETKGGGEYAQLHVIHRLADALDLSIDDLIDPDEEVEQPAPELSRRIGAHLLRSGQRHSVAELARRAGTSIEHSEAAIKKLSGQMRGTGIAVNRNDEGVQLVPAARTSLNSDPAAETVNRLSNLNHSDMQLLYRISTHNVHERQIANKKLNGLSSLSKLQAAGLITTAPDGYFSLTDSAAHALNCTIENRRS